MKNTYRDTLERTNRHKLIVEQFHILMFLRLENNFSTKSYLSKLNLNNLSINLTFVLGKVNIFVTINTRIL
jgi:hypothetical protein